MDEHAEQSYCQAKSAKSALQRLPQQEVSHESRNRKKRTRSELDYVPASPAEESSQESSLFTGPSQLSEPMRWEQQRGHQITLEGVINSKHKRKENLPTKQYEAKRKQLQEQLELAEKRLKNAQTQYLQDIEDYRNAITINKPYVELLKQIEKDDGVFNDCKQRVSEIKAKLDRLDKETAEKMERIKQQLVQGQRWPTLQEKYQGHLQTLKWAIESKDKKAESIKKNSILQELWPKISQKITNFPEPLQKSLNQITTRSCRDNKDSEMHQFFSKQSHKGLYHFEQKYKYLFKSFKKKLEQNTLGISLQAQYRKMLTCFQLLRQCLPEDIKAQKERALSSKSKQYESQRRQLQQELKAAQQKLKQALLQYDLRNRIYSDAHDRKDPQQLKLKEIMETKFTLYSIWNDRVNDLKSSLNKLDEEAARERLRIEQAFGQQLDRKLKTLEKQRESFKRIKIQIKEHIKVDLTVTLSELKQQETSLESQLVKRLQDCNDAEKNGVPKHELGNLKILYEGNRLKLKEARENIRKIENQIEKLS